MTITRWLSWSFILLCLLAGCIPAASNNGIQPTGTPSSPSETPPQATHLPEPISVQKTSAVTPTEAPSETPPNPLIDLYGCQMELTFTSGPLEQKQIAFTVLGQDYFTDKGGKFAPGQGTSIFYKPQRYLIVHSSYVNGNILRPMEAELIRKYLEHWGRTGPDYISEQIDNLIGSEARWTCDDALLTTTEISGVVRLSHEASQQLWLEPENLPEILSLREGIASEWVGDVDVYHDDSIYIGFCGWGPESIESGRYTYFRYLVQFTPIQ